MRVAVKIIKNLDRYREAAMSEVEVLEQMNKLDSNSQQWVARLSVVPELTQYCSILNEFRYLFYPRRL